MRRVVQSLRNTILAFVLIMAPVLLSIGLEDGGFVPLAIGRATAKVDLGVVRHPVHAGLDASGPGVELGAHVWKRRKWRDEYRLEFAHGLDAVDALEADHRQMAEDYHYQEVDEAGFRWVVPMDCVDGWRCVYDRILEDNAVALDALAERFRTHFEESGWDQAEAARWLLAFVQEIPYRLPQDHAFGVLPPAIVASRDWGDCDSKSLLLMAMLERLEIDSILMISQAHAHAMVGIAVPTGRNDTFRKLGREYAWAETTASFPLGLRDPAMRNPDDWRVAVWR